MVYGTGKMAFTNILPIADLGLPAGYKTSKAAIKEAGEKEKETRNREREKSFNFNLVRRHNVSKENHDNNKFENYFGTQTINHVKGLV